MGDFESQKDSVPRSRAAHRRGSLRTRHVAKFSASLFQRRCLTESKKGAWRLNGCVLSSPPMLLFHPHKNASACSFRSKVSKLAEETSPLWQHGSDGRVLAHARGLSARGETRQLNFGLLTALGRCYVL